MSDNKKYYYLKLKDNFFDSESIKILEQQENGYIYSNLYLKLCLMSLKGEGRLLFRDEIPYDEKMIATITGIPLDNVRAGLVILQRLGLITRIDSGEIYMSDIQAMIGHSSTETDRKKRYRDMLKTKDVAIYKGGTMSRECPVSVPPELEIREIDQRERLDKDIYHPGQDHTDAPKKDETEKLRKQAAFEHFWNLYDKKQDKKNALAKFMKIDEKLYPTIMDHVKRYVESKPDKQYRKDPASYLGNERWNDEIIQPGPASGPRKDTRMWQERNPFIDSLPLGSDYEEMGLTVVNDIKKIGVK